MLNDAQFAEDVRRVPLYHPAPGCNDPAKQLSLSISAYFSQ